jgi:4-aminobutyrate aminotransferase
MRSEGDLNTSSRRQAWSENHIGDETRKLLEEDSRYFLHQSLSTPCLNVVELAEGSYLIDAEGRRILDFHGNYVHQVGFGNEYVLNAMKQQMEKLPFSTRRYTNRAAIALAKKLSELAPGDLNRVLFAPGGATAVGMALKVARMATGRFKTISMWDSFHGASLDAVSVGGEAIFRNEMGPLMPGTEHVPPPNPADCPWDCRASGECRLKCASYIEYVLEKEGDVAAVVAETMRSSPIIPRKEYWQMVREACDRHGALLILDEIPHALGRSGKMFTVEHYGIVPDMLVIGKGLGGGILPWAALIAREGLNDAVKERAVGHYTHEKNPVACVAALATIEYIEKNKLLDAVVTKSEYFLKGLMELKSRYKVISDCRALGLMCGIELHDPESGEKATDTAEAVMYKALELGMNFKISMGNILTLTPPLTISPEELDEALHILDRAFSEAKHD